ncbi:MAG: DUF971 domain-containing protein [Planctomycetales bacterium]|nr:DUF971 domain-containing protein [Planctomycetales bacterium]NIP70266.1 DUF971 domain-containing protein [Planctomycetales bacterium]
MTARPTTIETIGDDQLEIAWNDGSVRRYGVRQLRDACPCATCREKKRAATQDQTQLPVLSAAETAPLKVLAMDPIGNYAYGIRFSDGHDTGIYQLELLRQLGEEV